MKTLGATRAHHGLINKATIMITSQHSPSNNQPSLYAMDYNGVGAAHFVIIRILPSKLHTVTAGHTYNTRLFPWPSRHVQSYTSGLRKSCGGAAWHQYAPWNSWQRPKRSIAHATGMWLTTCPEQPPLSDRGYHPNDLWK